MKATLSGRVIAQSEDLVEFDGYQYFPKSAVRLDWLEKAPKTESDLECPFDVQFYNVVIDGVRHERAAWTYESSRSEVKNVAGRFGFWEDVDVR